MEFIPNIDEAKKYIQSSSFSRYSNAYLVTNEDLHASMKYMPVNCNRALTVAASGDHPLSCSLHGAKYVDTFDVSYNAKCIMDIKTAALRCLSHSEYLDLLKNLYECCDMSCVPNMNKVNNFLPRIEYNYLWSMRGYPLFCHDTKDVKYNSWVPNQHEYTKLQKIVDKHYDFIMEDVVNIGDCITNPYDFMHLSNVFDYVRSGDYGKVILSLVQHVNPGGKIVTLLADEGRDEVFGFYAYKIVSDDKNWIIDKKHDYITQNKANKNGIYVLERVR